MIRKKERNNEKPVIDITGTEGNAFVILAYAKAYGRKLGLDVAAIQAEMTTGRYENLIKVFDKYFGDYVDIIR